MAITLTITIEARTNQTPNYTEVARQIDAVLALTENLVDWNISSDTEGDWAWTDNGGEWEGK